jgi:hypothetical protein
MSEMNVASLDVEIAPPKLEVWLDADARNRSVIMMNIDMDIDLNKLLHVDVNAIFDPIPVRRGILNREDWYIGSTGAEIVASCNTGVVRQFTEGKVLHVDYKNRTERTQKYNFSIIPKLALSSQSNGVELSTVGTFGLRAGSKLKYESEFSNSERILDQNYKSKEVRWLLKLPKGKQVVKDFLMGNLHLEAKFELGSKVVNGDVGIRPTDVRFFDEKGNRVGKLSTIMMLYAVWRKVGFVLDVDGFRVNYQGELS